MNKAIFLDRDGTINIDDGYISDPDKIILIDNSGKALRKFREEGYLLIVITNQSGIGRGYYGLDDYKKTKKRLDELLQKENIIIDSTYYCPHSPEENCLCRKPGTKMIEEAILEWNVSCEESYFIGDKESDVLCGKKMNTKTVLIGSDQDNFGQDYTCADLLDAFKAIQKK